MTEIVLGLCNVMGGAADAFTLVGGALLIATVDIVGRCVSAFEIVSLVVGPENGTAPKRSVDFETVSTVVLLADEAVGWTSNTGSVNSVNDVSNLPTTCSATAVVFDGVGSDFVVNTELFFFLKFKKKSN